jgi:hypothetical protein
MVLLLTNQTSLAKLPANSLPQYQALRALAALAAPEAAVAHSSSVQLVPTAGATVRVANATVRVALPRLLQLALTALRMSRSLFNRFGSSWTGMYYRLNTYWRPTPLLQPPSGRYIL